MPRLFPAEMLQHSIHNWVPVVTVKSQLIYVTVLLSVTAALVALPFIKVDVSVKAGGLVRPVTEKNELHSLVAGTIADVLVKEGDKVTRGQVLVRLQGDINDTRLSQTAADLGQQQQYIHDLSILAAGREGGLISPLYRQQYQRYQAQLDEQKMTLKKLRSDLDMYQRLYAQKVIATKEFSDRQYEYDKAMATYRSTMQQQVSAWQEDLSRLRTESNQLHADNQQLVQQKEWNLIKAPVSGTLQQFTGIYAGNNVQAGQVLGVISPDSNLVAECYVTPKDIGRLHEGMTAHFQVDAFNYNEWGLVEGTVQSIDNDFTLVDNQPVFKVKCRFAGTEVKTSNGIKGHLKKGMTLQARFLLARRSLFQLLYDKADDWINPSITHS